MKLGLKPEIACDIVDQAVSGGAIGRTPVLGTLAKGACKGFAGKVINAVGDGLGYAKDKAVQGAKAVGCFVLTPWGVCDKRTPPPPSKPT